jgi:hypothetical protein
MRYTCSKCKEKFNILNDQEPQRYNKKIVCSNCYYKFVGDLIERYPIGVHPRVLSKTAKELRDQFEKDLEQLQKQCKHKPSKWIEEFYFPMNSTGYKIKMCNICEKILDKKGRCSECRCVITEKNVAKIGDYWLGYCKKCSPKINKRTKHLEKQFNELEKKEPTKRGKRR